MFFDGVKWRYNFEYVPDVFSNYFREIGPLERNSDDESKLWPFCEVLWKLDLIHWDEYI